LSKKMSEVKGTADKEIQLDDRISGQKNLIEKLAALLLVSFAAGNLLILASYPIKPWVHLPLALGIATLLIMMKDKIAFDGGRSYLRLAFNILIVIFVVSALWYYSAFYQKLIMRPAMPKDLDIIFAAMLTIGCLEASRRANGAGLTVVAGVFLLYAFFGHHLPGAFGHAYFRPSRVLMNLFSDTGIFSSPLEVSATFVFLFILFGEFLNHFGGGDAFITLATGVAGQYRGGPAKVAVLSSALFGTIAGSSIANVAATGSFTIPLMKKIGYRPAFAGGVEAAASSGGQIMPPVMGSTAFILAEIVGVGYSTVAFKSIVPALLYFFAIFVMVDCEAVRLNLRGLPKEELPSLTYTLLKKWPYLLPIVVVFIALLVMKVSTNRAALMGIATTLIVPLVARGGHITRKNFIQALKSGADSSLGIISSCAVAGMIIGCLALTGLGIKIGNMLLFLSGGHTFPLLVAAMILSIILGMGLPTAPAYIVASSVVGPALVKVGIPMFNAHLFILYFAVLAMVTPPVALASYTAAGIAGAKASEVGWEGIKMTFAGFVVPYMFIYGPALLLEGSATIISITILTASLGVVFLGTSIQGYLFGSLGLFQRIMLFSASLCLIFSGLLTDLIGFGIALSALLFFKNQRERLLAFLSRRK